MRETLKFNFIWRRYFVIDLNVAQLKFAQIRDTQKFKFQLQKHQGKVYCDDFKCYEEIFDKNRINKLKQLRQENFCFR